MSISSLLRYAILFGGTGLGLYGICQYEAFEAR